ncbi:MAG TPA: FkbM family methyltransferase [Candidatus Dormibacteraeota bacterium]
MILGLVFMYSRVQALATNTSAGVTRRSRGVAFASPPGRSFGTLLATSPPAKKEMAFRMADGSQITCRIVDSGSLLSVYVDADYDLPGTDWDSVDTVIDVGAHVGSFTVWVARRAPRARIVAVEPNPQSFHLLERNIRLNGLSDRVRTINAAVGAEAGRVAFESSEHSLGTKMSTQGNGALMADVFRLADLIQESGFNTVDYLKLDTEGMEYQILKHADAGVLRQIRRLTCEYHPVAGESVQALADQLEAAGYSVGRTHGTVGVIWATRLQR